CAKLSPAIADRIAQPRYHAGEEEPPPEEQLRQRQLHAQAAPRELPWKGRQQEVSGSLRRTADQTGCRAHVSGRYAGLPPETLSAPRNALPEALYLIEVELLELSFMTGHDPGPEHQRQQDGHQQGDREHAPRLEERPHEQGEQDRRADDVGSVEPERQEQHDGGSAQREVPQGGAPL